MLLDPFDKIVTTTKRNHIYYGPTESKKVAVTLEEIAVDLKNVYDEFNMIRDNIDALASGYLEPSGYISMSGCVCNLDDIKKTMYNLENKINKRIYVQSEQPSVTA